MSIFYRTQLCTGLLENALLLSLSASEDRVILDWLLDIQGPRCSFPSTLK